MKNYVTRFTADRYGRKAGQYAMDGTLTRATDDLQQAYVFNTRMARRNAIHRMDAATMARWGVELIPITLTPDPS